MEQVTIPGWFMWIIGVFITLFIPWAIFVTVRIFQYDKDLALSVANGVQVNDDLKDLQEGIDKIDHKLDLFLNHEMNMLKQLIATANAK
jgi:hypothetical protein